ncbi:PTS fructose transporter subunit IIA [Clostridium polyendosporum]|uniref:PTS fructose transporter subunit IIA n=1 Tax=Clostridium polyendosporum TaxID=69208 RepID=A0A919S3F2_9CLOT|nr:PTS sugar transporter subunit IIA [Clostridium polyendosporum]GIM30656.1 PTS fructose transporter subunit IIA [Clostridium polyendosporum]
MSIKKMFSRERVSFNMKAKSKVDALDELINVLVKDGKVKDKEQFKMAVLKREEEYTTGIGMGIAIPHGKSNAVKEASIVFGRSDMGIEYDSMDGKPAHLFFLIAVPEESNDVHLTALSEISIKLMHSRTRGILKNCSNFEDFIKVFE